jgi:5-methylthioadenosine/S-adenosylhomocysteine deaminase
VDQDDVHALAQRGAAIAHCPRSNAAHRHGRALLTVFREAGIAVGLGTDSVVSVGELDLWAEAEAAGLAGDAALRALTLDGARALGWGEEIGSLDVGKPADVAIFPAAALRRPSPSSAALLTVLAGRIVHALDSAS